MFAAWTQEYNRVLQGCHTRGAKATALRYHARSSGLPMISLQCLTHRTPLSRLEPTWHSSPSFSSVCGGSKSRDVTPTISAAFTPNLLKIVAARRRIIQRAWWFWYTTAQNGAAMHSRLLFHYAVATDTEGWRWQAFTISYCGLSACWRWSR